VISIKNFSQGISNVSSFINEGLITIDSVENNALSNTGMFENNGSIFLKKSDYSIKNTNNPSLSFLNGPCGLIEASHKVLIGKLLRNEGTFVYKGDTSFSFFNNALFENVGVLNDYKNVIKNVPGLVNTGIIARGVKGKLSVDIKEMNLIEKPAVTSYTVSSTWWLNRF
jgi:hypothetical protein